MEEKNQNVVSNKKKFPIIPVIIGVVVIVLALVIILIVVILSNAEPKEKVYLTENEVSLIYGSPDNYKKKYVNLTAQVNMVTFDKKSQTIRAYVDIENYTNEVIVYLENKSISIKENDYISIDGYIKGADKETSKPYIIGKDVKVISYMDAVAPTKKEVKVDDTKSQHNVSVTIQKIEFSDVETRVYLKAQNGSNSEFTLSTYSAILTQSGKQYEVTYSKNSVDLSSKILPGGSTEGVIVFSKVNENNLSITLKGYSSDYDLDFENYSFDISVN